MEVVIVLAILVALIIVAGLRFPPGWNWIVMAAALAVFFMFLGRWIAGQALGIFISERNLMSLSRLQIVIWTVVLLSGFFTIALQRIHAGIPDPLNIALDPWLWGVMGISTASMVGTPLVLDSKRQKQPTEGVVRQAAAALNEPGVQIALDAQGTLYANKSPANARFTDIFEGDEIGNTAYLDLPKVQMFLFTLIAVSSYSYALYSAMFTSVDKLQMPAPSEGLVALLGISHLGYLTAKGVSHTATSEAVPPPPAALPPDSQG